MLPRSYLVAISVQTALLAALILGTGTCAGCDSMQAQRTLDSTKAIEALTAGERNVSYHLVPGDLFTGNNASNPLAGKIVAIPTVPGKDVEFLAFYPDGTPYMKLVTKRSVVIEAALAQIAGIDGAKLASDAAQREFYAAQMDKLLELVKPFLNQALANMQTPQTQGMSQLQRATAWRDMLTDPAFIAALRNVAATGQPTTLPAQ